jgi:hypothetical protein
MIFIARLIAVPLLAWGAWAGYIQYQRFDAARSATKAVIEKMKVETAEEIARRNGIIDAARKNAERMADTIAANSTKNQETLKKIDTYAASFTDLPPLPQQPAASPLPPARPDFLDARSVQYLNDIGRAPRGRAVGSKPDAKAPAAVRRAAAAPAPRN